MATLDELANKGATKYGNKISQMQTNFETSKDYAIAHYNATPFGTLRKQRYQNAWNSMPANYKAVIKPGKENDWKTAWIDAMSK